MKDFELTQEQVTAYKRDGYVIVKNFLTRKK